jgi:L-ribulose-5-phosphate 3-epimerase
MDLRMNTELSRRNFISSSLIVAGAGLSFAQSTQPQSMKKSVKYGMIGVGSTVRDKFQLIRGCGFEGVEVDSPSNLNLDEVLAARDATGLQIPGVVDSVHWHKTLGDSDANVRAEGRRALETALHDCSKLGGTSVLLVPAVVNQSISYDDAYERSQAEIRKVLPLAAELKVQIAIENVWNNFLLSPLEAARYIDELDNPWVGWHFDVGNVVNYGWPAQWIRILGERILKLDIKEFSRKKRDNQGLWKGFDVEIGDPMGGPEDGCDWPAVRQALQDIDYNGWACAEVGGGDEARLRDISGRMDHVLQIKQN